MRVIILFLAITCIASVGSAEDKKKMNLEERKAKVSGFIDKRISSLNEFKTCVGAVTEKGGIKACRKANKARMAAIKEERKAMKGQ